MKFVGIVGSSAERSYNRLLLEYIRKQFKLKFELEILEIMKFQCSIKMIIGQIASNYAF